MAKPKLLIAEDDEGLCSQYRWAFPACEILLAHTRPQALALVNRENPPIAIIDLGLPPDPDGVSEGFAMLSEVSRLAPRTKIIVVTGNGERSSALRAVALGAYDFCEKPVEIELLRTIIERGLNLHRLEEENHRLGAIPARSSIDRIVTASPGMLKLCRDVEKNRRDQRPRPAAGRKRHWQGSAGQGSARPQPARKAAVRGHQLRRHSGKPAGKRTVWA